MWRQAPADPKSSKPGSDIVLALATRDPARVERGRCPDMAHHVLQPLQRAFRVDRTQLGLSSQACVQKAVYPPSTGRTAPVMYDDSDDARKRMA